MLPFVASSVSTAMIALNRMSKFLSAEELEAPYVVDPDAKDAVAMDADFTWEAVKKSDGKDKKKEGDEAKEDSGKAKKDNGKKEKTDKKADKKGKKEGKEAGPSASPDYKKEDTEPTPEPEDPPFEVKDIKVNISKGSLVGIVGKIGSGKVREYSV